MKGLENFILQCIAGVLDQKDMKDQKGLTDMNYMRGLGMKADALDLHRTCRRRFAIKSLN